MKGLTRWFICMVIFTPTSFRIMERISLTLALDLPNSETTEAALQSCTAIAMDILAPEKSAC